jgi:glycosyltransferase involved in cell wall biosynthesis
VNGWRPHRVLGGLDVVRTIRTLKPDVAWLNLSFGAFGASRARTLFAYSLPALFHGLGVPIVVTLHEVLEGLSLPAISAPAAWSTRAGGRIATRLALGADVTCVTLALHASQLRCYYGATRVRHIPHGSIVEPELLPRCAPMREITLLLFGCLSPHKGPSVLLEAFEEVRRRHRGARLLIVGGDHPRFAGYCSTIRAQLRDGDGVECLGPQPEWRLRELFARCSAVVLPYLASTGASSVLYRAAALGRPVVMSDLPELRASAEEVGLQAEYVPPNDAVALAASIRHLLADEMRMEALARHNVAMMRQHTLAAICDRYLDVFRYVLARRPRRSMA